MSAQMGLEPGAPLGLSWIIPRRNKGRLEASFQLGYQGLRQLAYRSGMVRDIDARIVHDGDKFDFAYGLGGPNWTHVPAGEPGRDWTDVYCAAQTVLGADKFEAMSRAEVLEHRNRYVPDWSKSKAWKETEPEMARKTVTARLCRQLPMSVEFRTALAVDGATPVTLAPDLAGLVALEAMNEEENSDPSDD
jgi:recombination protein RecT